MPEKDPLIITLPEVRLSFPHLFTAHSMKDASGKEQEPMFSATFLFDNTKHESLLTHIDKIADRMCLDEFKKPRGPWLKYCLRDGNEKSELEGYGDGVSFIAARAKTRPWVADRRNNPIAEADSIVYAGCYVNATVRLWVQNNSWGKRINAQLRGVQFVRDGSSFGAGPIDGANEFQPLDSEDKTGAPAGGTTRSRSTGKPTTNLDDY